MNFRTFFLFIFLTASLALFQDYHYDYLDYDAILAKIAGFVRDYPQFIQMYNITDQDFPFPNIMPCEGDNKCQFVYYIMTDFSQSLETINQLPQVLLIGGIHGNEIVGTNAIVYLTQYFLENMSTNLTISTYLRSRMMILYPMANPYGFANNVREEYHYGGYIFDPNRDFPYNLGNDQCFLTATARVLNYIFSNYLIRLCISFHGGTNSISYPWGSYNHLVSVLPIISQSSPDNSAFEEIAQVLSDAAGDNPNFQIIRYPTGIINEIVYPVDGGSEDWAYAAGWENQVSTSEVITLCQDQLTFATDNNTNIRTMLFLIECDYLKEPPNNISGWASGLLLKNNTNWGHVTRNIATSIALIDLAKPYVRDLEVQSNQLRINVTWKGGGCISVDYTTLFWRKSPSNSLLNNISMYNSTNLLASDRTMIPTQILSGAGYWSNNSFQFSEQISFNSEAEIDVVIVMSCDKGWGDLVIQSPLISPQSHEAQARTNPSYSFKHQDYIVSSDKYVFGYANNIPVINQSNKSSSESLNYYSIFLQSTFMQCNPRNFASSFSQSNFFTFNYNDLINLNSNGLLTLSGSISINVELQDILTNNLTAFLFQFGDISECMSSSIGENIDPTSTSNYYYLYFNGTFQRPLYFFENSLMNFSNGIYLTFEETVQNVQNFSNLIGRSVLLSSFSVNTFLNISSSPYYIGYITFSQSYQCSNNAEACLGTGLEQDAVCALVNMDQFFKSYTNFIIKIIIDPPSESNPGNISLSLLLNLHYLKAKFGDFSSISLKNDGKTIEIPINSRQSINFIFTEPIDFPLLYSKALGNAFAVSINNGNLGTQLGVCDIVLLDPSFNTESYVESLNTEFAFASSSDQNERLIELSVGIGVPLICVLITVVWCLRKRHLRHRMIVVPSGLLDTPKPKDVEDPIETPNLHVQENHMQRKASLPEDNGSAEKIIRKSIEFTENHLSEQNINNYHHSLSPKKVRVTSKKEENEEEMKKLTKSCVFITKKSSKLLEEKISPDGDGHLDEKQQLFTKIPPNVNDKKNNEPKHQKHKKNSISINQTKKEQSMGLLTEEFRETRENPSFLVKSEALITEFRVRTAEVGKRTSKNYEKL